MSMEERETLVLFEAALPDTHQIALKLKSGGEATLTLQLSHEAALTIGAVLPQLEGRTFAVAVSLKSIEELAAASHAGSDTCSISVRTVPSWPATMEGDSE